MLALLAARGRGAIFHRTDRNDGDPHERAPRHPTGALLHAHPEPMHLVRPPKVEETASHTMDPATCAPWVRFRISFESSPGCHQRGQQTVESKRTAGPPAVPHFTLPNRLARRAARQSKLVVVVLVVVVAALLLQGVLLAVLLLLLLLLMVLQALVLTRARVSTRACKGR